MECMRIGKTFGPIVSGFINKTIKNKHGRSPEIKIEEIDISQLPTPEDKDNRVGVTIRATISEDELQKLLMEVTK